MEFPHYTKTFSSYVFTQNTQMLLNNVRSLKLCVMFASVEYNIYCFQFIYQFQLPNWTIFKVTGGSEERT